MTENKDLLRLDTVNTGDLSPMMKQYVELRKTLGDTILFYRLGDFYEMFFDDAILVSKTLELTLTGRDCGNNMRAPMCGVPFHAYSTYANKLLNLGFKIAICEQLEDPATCKGLVKRGIIQVLTPGTLTDNNGLEDRKNNFLMSIYSVGSQYGVSVADITTGVFEGTQLTSLNNDEHLINLIGKYTPSEIIYNESFESTKIFKALKTYFQTAFTSKSDRFFSSSRSEERKNEGKSAVNIDQFKDPELLNCAAGGLLNYADETQAGKIYHLDALNVFKISDTMELDYSTRANLELTSTIRSKSKKGSLLWAIDRTKTAMGGRLIRKWVEEPLVHVSSINARLDAVQEAYDKFMPRQEIIEALSGLYDIERLISRVALGNCNARELISLKYALGKIPYIIDRTKEFSKGVFRQINQDLDPLTDVYEILDAAIAEEPPIGIKDGDIIKKGYSKECDELAEISSNAKAFIMKLENDEKEKTGIRTLKIGYNKVFGYYIEVSKSFAEQVPEHYIRKQTLVNAERYITPEIKELEDKILGASSKRNALEYEIFCDIRQKVSDQQRRIFATAKAVSILDVITSLAELASTDNYVRPKVDDSEVIEIEEGRHPVVEQMLRNERFVPNDTDLNSKDRLMVLTGPNMSGKSTYMRQIALIVLLAQIGSFVPAKSAHIGLVDRIFTRIGASDDISLGQSTFMVEMSEVSNILNNASRKSLLLLDEVGRGTSTYDGLSIAWAVIEYIIDPNILYARTIFATHYHELNQLTKLNQGVFNCHVDVKEKEDGVVFLHKIVSGGTSDSYGIEVARLAGIPDDVLRRSKAILSELERIGNFKVNANVDIENGDKVPTAKAMPGQDSLFNPENVYYQKEDKLRKHIRDIDITKITPLEAMNILYELTEIVNKENQIE
ncbi:MAG: DNA mismatch repair protein MutS [Clostridia bacterium]|nr:DNA mismatch repair protein MutS [Clostridia bacterium]